MTEGPYRLFEVCGLELEYPIVDSELHVQPLVEPAFRLLAGRPTSDVAGPRFGFSNELADHVFELKNPRPLPSLVTAEADLVAGVTLFSNLLREHFGARLLPGGMHPFMDPRLGRTWRRANRRVYEAYAAVFDLSTHGWMNVQSCHVNLPFGTERETLVMLDATACLLPYLPALSASSPVHDGELGPFVDNRLAFYRTHQARVPQTQGRVVPEHVGSFAEYKRDVLGGIYRALREIPEAAPLRREFCNARGAILRFVRQAMEIRVLDVQECPRADMAIAALVFAVLRELVARHGARLPDFARRSTTRARKAQLLACARHGLDAPLRLDDVREAFALPAGVRTARGFWRHMHRRFVPGALVAAHDAAIATILRRGNLADRLLACHERRGRSRAGFAPLLRALADCLAQNRMLGA